MIKILSLITLLFINHSYAGSLPSSVLSDFQKLKNERTNMPQNQPKHNILEDFLKKRKQTLKDKPTIQTLKKQPLQFIKGKTTSTRKIDPVYEKYNQWIKANTNTYRVKKNWSSRKTYKTVGPSKAQKDKKLRELRREQYLVDEKRRKLLKEKYVAKRAKLQEQWEKAKAIQATKKAEQEKLSKKSRVAIATPRIKEKGITVKPIMIPLTPKKPTNAILPPRKITPPKQKPQIVQKDKGKTTLKNVNILTKAKTGNINTEGKLNIANVKVAKGSTLKDTNINADVNVKNISVSKGSSADIGSVKIEK